MATVLIADDSSFMRGSLQYMVEKIGHKTVGMAKDGAEAVELYRRLNPDLTTLDILMKGIGGLVALREIMKINPGAKVIMVAVSGQEDQLDEALKLGASGYIRKPFSYLEIENEIKRVLGKDKNAR